MAPQQVGATGSQRQPILLAANNCHRLWWRDPGLRNLNFWLGVLFMSPFMIGFDGSLISGLLAIPRWLEDLGSPDSSQLGLIIAAQSLGGLIGFLPTSYLMDKFGRRKALILGDTLVIGAAIGQAFCRSWASYLGTRLVLGVGVVICLCAVPVLLSELAHPRQRGSVGSLFGSFFFLGAIFSAWTTFGTLHITSSWSWRIPTLLQILPATIQASLVLFVPESPRWLVKKDRNEEAREFFIRYHANGVRDDELALLEYTEVCQMIQHEASADTTGWLDYVRTAANRKRLFITIVVALFAQWSGNGIVSYYFVPVLQSAGISSPAQQAGINGGLQIFNWFMVLWASTLMDKVGRRTLFLASSTGMLLTLTAVTVCNERFLSTGNKAAGYCMIVFLFLFNGAYDFAYSPLPTLYTSEIHPFDLRAKGVSLNFAASFGFGLFNQYVNPIGLEAISWKYYIVFISIVAIQLPVVYFIFPETKGLTVEEVKVLFEGGSTSEALEDLRSSAKRRSLGSVHAIEEA